MKEFPSLRQTLSLVLDAYRSAVERDAVRDNSMIASLSLLEVVVEADPPVDPEELRLLRDVETKARAAMKSTEKDFQTDASKALRKALSDLYLYRISNG